MADATLVDLVKITALTTGTGAVTLGEAVPGYRGREALLDGAVYGYSIQQEAEYELGRCTYLLADRQIVRTPEFSSNGGLPINLQANAAVAFVATAEDILGRDVLRPLYGYGKPTNAIGLIGQTYTDKNLPVTLYGPKTASGWGVGVVLSGGPGKNGVTGPADNTYSSYAAMQASDPTRKSARLVGDTDFPPHPDGPYNNPTQTVGGWVPQITDGPVYTLPAQAAQPQSQSDKNEQTVDVFDALTPAMRSAMRGGSYVDVGPAIDAICNFAAGAESVGTVGGVTLWFKGGRYSSSVPLRNTIRYDQQITDDGDCRRMNLCGDGSANTMFFYQGDPSIPAYSVRGYNGGNGHDLYHVIEGLRIRRQFGARGQGTGVKMLDVADVHWNDVHVDGFNVGIDAEGVLGWHAENLFILGNNGGLLARVGNGFTRPNAWQFLGGKLSGNSVYGAQFTDAANISFRGTRFEANGDGQVGNEPNKANQFVLRMIGAPAEGGAWLDLVGCYFENNNVETEVLLATSADSVATVGIRTCSFQRISDIRNPNRHIDFVATGNSKVLAHLDAVPFRSIGARTPSASFTAWRNQSSNTIVTTSAVVYESALEGPDTGNFPLIGNNYIVLDAMINADGAYNADPMITSNVREVVKTGTGKYTIYFKTPPVDAASVRYISQQDGNNGPATVTFKSSGGVDVETKDIPGASGSFVDRAFVIQGLGRFA